MTKGGFPRGNFLFFLSFNYQKLFLWSIYQKYIYFLLYKWFEIIQHYKGVSARLHCIPGNTNGLWHGEWSLKKIDSPEPAGVILAYFQVRVLRVCMLSHQEEPAQASIYWQKKESMTWPAPAVNKVIKDSKNVAELEMNHCVAGEDEVILAVNSVQDLNKNKNQASNSAE